MLEERTCHPSQVPLGCVLKNGIYDEKNTLLLREGTRVTDRVYQTLLRYNKPIKVLVEVKQERITPRPKEVKQDLSTKPQRSQIDSIKIRTEDKSFSLSSEIKERTKQGVEYIYNNPNSTDVITTASEVSTSLLDVVNASSDINISLNSIKVSDDYTFKHCVDVSTMGLLLGRQLKLDESYLRDIAVAGVLHDLGKTKIPDEILNKPGKLTDSEFRIIQTHPIYGYELVAQSKQLTNRAKLGIIEHHEKIDGTGYPRKLKGEQISLIGKILAVVDVYDALVTKRPYRTDLIEPAEAIEMMLSMYNQFDLDILKAFLNCIILYPIGSRLMLSDNRVYEVVAQNEGYPTRPIVKDILTNITYDLCRDAKCLSLVIVSGV